MPAAQRTPSGPRQHTSSLHPGPRRLSLSTCTRHVKRPSPRRMRLRVSTRTETSDPSDGSSSVFVGQAQDEGPVRKRLSGQTGLRRERQIEIPAEVDHQQPESSGASKLIGGPQALAPAGETNHRERSQVDAALGRIGGKEGALGPGNPRDRIALAAAPGAPG